MKLEISATLKKLAEFFPDGLFVVGGYVRNSLLKIELDDIDLAGAVPPTDLLKLLEKSGFNVKIKSKTLGTAIIFSGDERFEYSCFRRETYGEGGEHSPVEVEFVKEIEEDAKRRDFTINAIYYDIKKDEFIDFYHGLDDIKNRLLRTVETPEYVLSKDGVRILRLFRLQSELGFKIEKETLRAAIKYSGNVRAISNERRVGEFVRILHSGQKYKISKPNAFMKSFKIFNKARIWSNFGIDVPRIKFDMVKKVEHKAQGFLIDLVDTVNPISVSYYLEQVLKDQALPKRTHEQVINILSGYYSALNREANKPYFFKYFDNFPSILLLLNKKSKIIALKYEFFYKYIISHKLVISVKELKINGDDIKKHYPQVNPKRYKAILESLLSDVFECKVSNEKKELISAVEQKLKYL